MHSFQPSRGRILFEVFCAVGIAASCGGAWMQTGASALLAASFIGTLYGLVHFFDLFRSAPSVATEPQRIDFTEDGQADLSDGGASVETAEEPLVAFEQPAATNVIEVAEFVEPVAPKAAGARKAKAPRKGGRGTASKKAKPVDVVVPEDTEAVEPLIDEEVHHAPVAPLFEPDPFVRMPRQAFGRRGRI